MTDFGNVYNLHIAKIEKRKTRIKLVLMPDGEKRFRDLRKLIPVLLPGTINYF